MNPKKIYLIDTCFHGKIGFASSADRGFLLENVVYLQLIGLGKEVFYHKSKKECDFVIRDGMRITSVIQVSLKLSEPHVRKREFDGLFEAICVHNLDSGIILTGDEEGRIVMDDKIIRIIPVWKWLLEDTSLEISP